MESPDELLARLKLGREEYSQRLLTSLILDAPYPRWNSRNVPCERGFRFLELLERNSFGEAKCRAPYEFVDELDLGRRPQDLKASAPDWAVFTSDRLWIIELKTERGSHRSAQVPTYVATGRHHYPDLRVDLTYITGPMSAYAPDLPPGTRYAHLTWDAVVPIVEQVWNDGTPGQRAIVERIGEVVASLARPWSAWREARLGHVTQEEVPVTTHANTAGSDRDDPVGQALELARLTAADHEQRAVDFAAGSLERLREVGLAIREALDEDGDEVLSHVLPWLWNVDTSTGKALTAAGAESATSCGCRGTTSPSAERPAPASRRPWTGLPQPSVRSTSSSCRLAESATSANESGWRAQLSALSVRHSDSPPTSRM